MIVLWTCVLPRAELFGEDCTPPAVGVTYSVQVCQTPKVSAIQCALSPKKSGVFPSLNKLPGGGSGDIASPSTQCELLHLDVLLRFKLGIVLVVFVS